MHLLWTLIVGLIIGALAKAVMPGKDPGGILVTMLLGIAGSFVATYIGRALGIYGAGNAGAGIIASIIGSVLLLVGYRAIVRRRTV